MNNTLINDLREVEKHILNSNLQNKGSWTFTDIPKEILFDAYNSIPEVWRSKIHPPWTTSPLQNYYWFEYRLPERPRTKIIVKSTEQKLK